MGCAGSTEDEVQPAATTPNNNHTNLDPGRVTSFVHTHTNPQMVIPGASPHTKKKLAKYVGLYDYDARTPDDLTFRKGDILLVKSKADGDWWLAQHENGGPEGYVPSNYIAKDETIDMKDWYFGAISRKEAEKTLLVPGLQKGSFLIRESESAKGNYSLSLLDMESNRTVVKHYRIRSTLNDQGYYITDRIHFTSLDELVQHYEGSADGLACQMTIPCPKSTPNSISLGKDAWEIPRESLAFNKKLGAGQFGEVWQGTWNGNTAVAVKTLKEGTMTPDAFLEEANIMKKLRHKHLVSLFAVCSDKEPIYIVTELMSKGSLLDFLRDDSYSRTLKLTELIDLAAQIACGLAFLETGNFIHRDIAARNILIGDAPTSLGLVAKVADFGLSRLLMNDEYNPQTTHKFPIKWTAPEVFLYDKFSIKSDVWSYGILLVEIVTKGRVPYPGLNNKEVVDQVPNGYRMPQPQGCPDSMYDMLKKCWHSDPQSRPTFEFLYHFMDDYFVATEPNYKDPEY
ncbi:tyrosine-protein kinase STK-like [Amphiura filiformis]|uniref:tyrosine-protein kinase STK-like n=1 Tax=Amphiura filiformis TaxID=82378 RepID=UPI003B21CB38